MDVSYPRFVSSRRAILGLSQRDLARRSGVAQPLIAAIETGRRRATTQTATALDAALRLRPSQALAARRQEVLRRIEARGGHDPIVFGSVARGTDREDSDLDLIVTFPPGASLMDALDLRAELEDLLTVPVEVVSAGSSGLDRLDGPRFRVAA